MPCTLVPMNKRREDVWLCVIKKSYMAEREIIKLSKKQSLKKLVFVFFGQRLFPSLPSMEPKIVQIS